MMHYFYRQSVKSTSWLLLAFSALILIATALWFQHVENYQPCIMCIYERCAIIIIMLAGLIGALAPKSFLRPIALLLWLTGSTTGLILTVKQVYSSLHPTPFAVCSFAPAFPTWLPLDKWLPSLFSVSALCNEKQWSFLTLTMPQWLVMIFAAYLIVALIVLVSQFSGRYVKNGFIN